MPSLTLKADRPGMWWWDDLQIYLEGGENSQPCNDPTVGAAVSSPLKTRWPVFTFCPPTFFGFPIHESREKRFYKPNLLQEKADQSLINGKTHMNQMHSTSGQFVHELAHWVKAESK